jgi:hypothetical protein
MADKKISELDAASALQAADVAPFVQSGANVKATTQQIITAVTGATGTNGETVTTSKPRLDLTQTWNAAGTTFTALKFNVTDTASAAESLLMDLQVGGNNRFKIDKAGGAFLYASNSEGVKLFPSGSSLGIISAISAGAQLYLDPTNRTIKSNSTMRLNEGAGIGIDATDVVLTRDAADILAQRRTTNAQTFRIYNTFTDASNYERGKMEWASNVLRIGTEKAGTGTARALEFQTDGTTRLTIGTTGAPTFTGVIAAPAIAVTDYVGCGRVNFTAVGQIKFESDGVVSFRNAGLSDFNRLQFGGITSSFPALKRSTTSLQARLADDSAFTNIQGKLTTETAYTAGAPTATGYIVLYDSTGTAYKVPAEAL